MIDGRQKGTVFMNVKTGRSWTEMKRGYSEVIVKRTLGRTVSGPVKTQRKLFLETKIPTRFKFAPRVLHFTKYG